MHRVVTDTRDHRGLRIVEAGPWLEDMNDVEYWADVLRNLGYKVRIERMNGEIGRGGDSDLANALAGMA